MRRVIFPYIPPGSNQLFRMHRNQVGRLRRDIHDDMGKLITGRHRPYERARMTLDFHWRTRTKRDPLNYVEGAKAIVDALVGVWITDDDAAHLEAVVRGQVGTGASDRVVITVEELTMTERVVFGEADPRHYIAPLCACGHQREEHHGDDVEPQFDACWHGWDGDEEGCRCMYWTPQWTPPRAGE